MIKWILLIALLVFLFLKRGDLMAFIGQFAAKGDIDSYYSWLARGYKLGGMSYTNSYQYAFLTFKRGQMEEAKKLYTLISLSTSKPHQRNQIKGSLALIHWKNKEYDEAIEMLEEVMAAGKNTVTYGSLGVIYLEAGRAERALEFCTEAYEYNPDDMIITDNYAAALAANGKTDEAEEIYRKLIGREKAPHFPEPYYGLGLLLAEKGEKEEAKELLETALEKKFQFTSTITKEQVEDALENL